MGASNEEVAKAFARREAATGGNMFTDGKVVYSYGNHFPIAAWLPDGRALFNESTWSATTSRHKSEVFRAVGSTPIVLCNVDELKGFVRSGCAVIERSRVAVGELEIRAALHGYLENSGMTSFVKRNKIVRVVVDELKRAAVSEAL